MRNVVDRRSFALGSAGLLGLTALGACASPGTAVRAASDTVRRAEAGRRRPGQPVVRAVLTPRPATVDLGGQSVETWVYGDSVPGPLLRATAGDLLQVRVDNGLPDASSVHFHGVAMSNDMDGVPGLTQDPIGSGAMFRYEFTVPHPGTYFYHPHSGVQLDRGLYGVLVVDDRSEPGDYDAEWILVLDDWVDGTGRTPDQVFDDLRSTGRDEDGGMGGGSMGMDHGTMGMGGDMSSSVLGGAGDIDYPSYLANGRLPAAPDVFTGRPGQRVRIRIVNAGSDTAFRVALGSHSFLVTHSDGFPVVPTPTDALLIGMGERHDVVATLADGVFPLVASAEGKTGGAMAVVRTGAGPVPPASADPAELRGRVVTGTDLTAVEGARLKDRPVDRTHDLVLGGSMSPYRWTINGQTFEDSDPLQVRADERVRLRMSNMSMMFHPMHVHGHTFGLALGGARKDTVVVRPMQTVVVDLDADNPGQWAAHCHNIYHAEAGMMTTLSYRA